MVAAQNISGDDSLLTTLLGFGLLALFVAVLVALHILRWRRHGVAPRVAQTAPPDRGAPRIIRGIVSARRRPAAGLVGGQGG